MNDKQKVLIVFPDLMIGGATSAFLTLLRKIDYTKNDVDVLFLNNGEYRLQEISEYANVLQDAAHMDLLSPQIRLRKICNFILSGKAVTVLCETVKFKKRVKMQDMRMPINQMLGRIHGELCLPMKQRYDLAVAYLEFWPTYYVAEKVKATSKVAWVHLDYLKAGLIPAIDASSYSKMDRIIGVSEQCAQQLRNCFPQYSNKIGWTENFVDEIRVRKMAGIQEPVEKFFSDYSGFRIITVARLDSYTKGLDRVVNVCAKLVADGFDFRWYIIGGGSDEQILRNQINKMNLSNNVYLLGSKDNPYPYMAQADLFVLASRNEGKPITVTEAQILNTPVLVTKYPTAEEQVALRNGIVVENGEKPLYYKIFEILSGNLKVNSISYQEASNDLLLKELKLV